MSREVVFTIPEGEWCHGPDTLCPLYIIRSATDFCFYKKETLDHQIGTGYVKKPVDSKNHYICEED